MGSVSNELPPMAKISLIGIWIETLLYGVNCVMYGLCMSILLRGKTPAMPWVLLVICTILFLLGTAHVGVSLLDLLEAFIDVPPNIPDYSTIYWLDFTTPLRVVKDVLYDTLVLIQYVILTWRLYVVYMCNWRVIVFPIILATGGVCTMFAASAVSAFPNSAVMTTLRLLAAAWACGMAHNLCVTGAIVARLLWMGKTIASFTGTSTNRFATSVYIVIESGAISAVCDIVILVMFASNNIASFSCLDVVSQLTVLTPLLIIVQVGRTGRYRTAQVDPSKTTSGALSTIMFRSEGASQQASHDLELRVDSRVARSPSSITNTHV